MLTTKKKKKKRRNISFSNEKPFKYQNTFIALYQLTAIKKTTVIVDIVYKKNTKTRAYAA